MKSPLWKATAVDTLAERSEPVRIVASEQMGDP